jgi:hypothetical protein
MKPTVPKMAQYSPPTMFSRWRCNEVACSSELLQPNSQKTFTFVTEHAASLHSLTRSSSSGRNYLSVLEKLQRLARRDQPAPTATSLISSAESRPTGERLKPNIYRRERSAFGGCKFNHTSKTIAVASARLRLHLRVLKFAKSVLWFPCMLMLAVSKIKSVEKKP